MISIVIPVYKVESYLRQCVDSILEQTYQEIEILLVDDGSPDKCGEICDEYARIDNRIRVFHTENKGVSAARNLGLREAKGDYFGFVDPDDWIEPDMYEILLRRLEETGADISVCSMWLEYTNERRAEKDIQDAVYKDSDVVCALLRYEIDNYVCNKLFRKDCWTNIRFPEGQTYEDVAAIYRIIMKAHVVSCTSAPLYHYRMRNGSTIHRRTKETIMDNWNTYYTRYLQLCSLPQVKNDERCIYKSNEKLGKSALQTWLWASEIPKEERDYCFLQEVADFVKKHVPLFGYKNWPLFERICCFFSHSANDVSFATLHTMRYCYHLVKKEQKTNLYD